MISINSRHASSLDIDKSSSTDKLQDDTDLWSRMVNENNMKLFITKERYKADKIIQDDLHHQYSSPSLTLSLKSSSSSSSPRTAKTDFIDKNTNMDDHKLKKRRNDKLAKKFKTVIRNKWKQPWALSSNLVADNPRHQAAKQRRDNLIKGKKKSKPIQSNNDMSRASGGKNNALRELKILFEKGKYLEKKSIRPRVETQKKKLESKSEKPNYFSKAYLDKLKKSINIEEPSQAQNDVTVILHPPKVRKIQKLEDKSKKEKNQIIPKDEVSQKSSSTLSLSSESMSTKSDFYAYVCKIKYEHKNFNPMQCYLAAVNGWSRIHSCES